MTDSEHLEKRKYPRIELVIPARFLTEDGVEDHATVENISAGGIALHCDKPPARGTKLIIYVDDIGRFEGKIVRQLETSFAVEFSSQELKLQRTARRLEEIDGNDAAASEKPPTVFTVKRDEATHLCLSDGKELKCKVLDLSLGRILLSVLPRPPIGERVRIGVMEGCISAHHARGVAVEIPNVQPQWGSLAETSD